MQSILFTELVYAEYTVHWVNTVYAEFILFTGSLSAIFRVHWKTEAADSPCALHQESAVGGENRPAVRRSRTSATQWRKSTPIGCQGLAMLYSAFSIWLHSSWSCFNSSGIRLIAYKSWTKGNTSSRGIYFVCSVWIILWPGDNCGSKCVTETFQVYCLLSSTVNCYIPCCVHSECSHCLEQHITILPIPPSHTHSIMWRRRRRRFWHSPRSRLNWTSWSSNRSPSNGSPVAGGSGLPSLAPSPPMSLLTFRWTLTSGGGLWPLK